MSGDDAEATNRGAETLSALPGAGNPRRPTITLGLKPRGVALSALPDVSHPSTPTRAPRLSEAYSAGADSGSAKGPAPELGKRGGEKDEPAEKRACADRPRADR
jgi:hypothetical protein